MRRSAPRRYYSPLSPRLKNLRLRHFFWATWISKTVMPTASIIVSALAPPELAVEAGLFHANAGEINISISYKQRGGML